MDVNIRQNVQVNYTPHTEGSHAKFPDLLEFTETNRLPKKSMSNIFPKDVT